MKRRKKIKMIEIPESLANDMIDIMRKVKLDTFVREERPEYWVLCASIQERLNFWLKEYRAKMGKPLMYMPSLR